MSNAEQEPSHGLSLRPAHEPCSRPFLPTLFVHAQPLAICQFISVPKGATHTGSSLTSLYIFPNRYRSFV